MLTLKLQLQVIEGFITILDSKNNIVYTGLKEDMTDSLKNQILDREVIKLYDEYEEIKIVIKQKG